MDGNQNRPLIPGSPLIWSYDSRSDMEARLSRRHPVCIYGYRSIKEWVWEQGEMWVSVYNGGADIGMRLQPKVMEAKDRHGLTVLRPYFSRLRI